MINILKKRVVKRNFGSFLNFLTKKRLRYLSKNYSKDRDYKIATFANDLIGIDINTFGIYEKEELEMLFEFLSPLEKIFEDGTAFDVGANIGNHSMFFSKKFKRIHSFEPHPSTFYILNFNTNQLKNISTHNIGLGDESGIFKLFGSTEESVGDLPAF
jgi:hypothetical protein